MISPQLQQIINIAIDAGKILRKHHQTDFDVQFKADKYDPVTIADTEADQYIRAALERAFPGDEILSEEHDARPASYAGRVWMVDPMDGTKGFVAGGDDFSVMIGLLEAGKPVLGVVYAPIRDELLYAEAGQGSYWVSKGETSRNKVSAITTIEEAIHVVRSRGSPDKRNLDAPISELRFKDTIAEGSIGLKIGLIATSKADVFINTNTRASKWDTLAGQVILVEAGGVISDLQGMPLDYMKPTVEWDKYFVVAGTDRLQRTIISAIGKLTDQVA